jgi:hypothetical protein
MRIRAGHRAAVYDQLQKKINPTQTDGQVNQARGRGGREAVPKRRTTKSMADQQARKERLHTGTQW